MVERTLSEADTVFDTLDRLRAGGKVDAYGWSTDFPERADAFGRRDGFVAIEHCMNVFFAASDLLATVERHGLLSLNRSPLAMGLLTGKFSDGKVPTDDIRGGNHQWMDYFKGGRVVPSFAHRLAAIRDLLMSDGRTLAQGALAWLWARSDRTIPLPGFRNVAQVEENAGALEKGPLRVETIAEIERLIVREPEGVPRER